jgi:spermidine/putrescine transport system ATP-binding protein
MTMADTIAVMNAGVIEQMGAPEELYENPRLHVRRPTPRPDEPHRGQPITEPAATWSRVDYARGIRVTIPSGSVHARR